MAQLDPLLALRSTLSSSKSITLLSSSQTEVYTLSEASHISFPHLPSSPSYARSTQTRLSAGTNPNLSDPSTPYYDLQTLLFGYLHRDAPTAEYLKLARGQGVGFVSSIDRKLVIEYLGGKGEAAGRIRPLNQEELEVVKRDLPDQLHEGEGGVKVMESENQKEDTSASAGGVGSKGDGGQPPMKKARYTANKEDQDKVKKMLSIIQGPQYGHVLAPTDGKGGKEGPVTADKVGGAWHSRETVLRGERYNNFDSVRSLIQPRLQSLQSTSSSSSSKPSVSSSSKPAQSAVSSSKKKQLNPIIMISPSSTALLTMHNIKPFLEESKFIPSDQARALAAGASTGYVAEDVIQVNHSRASGGSGGQTIETRKARYFVVDSVEALAKFGGAGRVDEAWDRVVCVMTTGQEWQFKPYKWKEPKELFHHVKGVYPQWSTDAPNAKMKSWNVSDLRIDPHKRHVDKSVAADFWRSLETWIAREKPWLSY